MNPLTKFNYFFLSFIKNRRYLFYRLPNPFCKLCFQYFFPPQRWHEIISPIELSDTEKKNFDVHLVSFLKCGRTWLRLMIGKAIEEHFELKCTDEEIARLYPLANYEKIPRIRVHHDDNPHYKAPEDLTLSKKAYRNTKVIFLSRDPRDVLVSNYFQITKRQLLYCNDISNYLREDVGSTNTLIKYYNIWAIERNVPKDFLLVRYEDIHLNPALELAKCFDFIGLDISSKAISRAVEFASFDNMHTMEKENGFNAGVLKGHSKGDPESYKTREGKVGGFSNYLSPEDIRFLNKKIQEELTKFYGY